MLKKSLSLILIVTLLLGMLSLQAEAQQTEIRVQAEDYDDVGMVSAAFENWGTQLRLYSGDWTSYKVNFQEAGHYEIKLRLGAYKDNAMPTHTVTPYYDGVSLGSATYTPASPSGTGENWEWHSVGIVKVEVAGEHEIKLMFDNVNIRFNYFDLVPVEVDYSQPIVVHAMNDLVEGAVHDTSITTYARLYDGNYLVYDVTFPVAGTYSLRAVAAQGIVQNSFLNFSIDGSTVTSALITRTGGFEKWQDFEAGFVGVAEAGTIRFTLTVPSGNFSLKSFEFTLVDDFWAEAEKSTLSEECITKALSENQTVVLMEQGDSISFDAVISDSGVYSLLLDAAGVRNCSLTVSDDDSVISETELTFTDGWSKFSEHEIELRYLTSGKHTFTISVDGGEISIDKVVFDRDEGVSLVSEQNQSTLEGSIRNFTTDEVNGKIIYSLYDSHGNLKDYDTEENISVSASDKYDLSHTFTDACNGDTGRIYYWGGQDGLKPLTGVGQTEFSFENTEPCMQIYVDEAGNDNDDGSIDAPFATIERALQEVAAFNDQMDGDIEICINPGTYYISDTIDITNEHSGKNGYRVIIRAADADSIPVVHGGVRVTGWTEGQNGIWSAPFDAVDEVRNLYVDGYAAQRARSSYLYKAMEYYSAEGSGYSDDGVSVSLDGFPQSFEHPGDLEAIWDIEWTSSHIPVNSVIYDSDSAKVVFDQPYYSYIRKESNTMVQTGRSFYLENDLSLLDERGEFYYDKHDNIIYYYPFEEEDLDRVYVPSTEGLLKIMGTADEAAQNITLRNIEFRYGAWNDVSTYGIRDTQADGMSINDVGAMMPAQLDVSFADGIHIEDLRISSMGSAALAMSNAVTDSSVTGCVITDCSATGIILGHWRHTSAMPEGYARCTDIKVTDNIIKRCGLEYKGSCGISAYYVQNTDICHNDLETLPYTGISLGWGWGTELVPECRDNTIAFNRVADVMNALEDGGHIYTLGALRNTHIYENMCTVSGDYRGGIYTDNGTGYITVRDNVISGSVHNWLYSVADNLGDVLLLNNFTDTERLVNDFPQRVNVVGTTLISDIASDVGAYEILQNSGSRSANTALDDGIEYPLWRTQFIKNVPHSTYMVYPDGTIQAESYTGGSPREFTDTSITLDPGDSVSYKVNLEFGNYKIKTSGWLDQSYPSTIGIYVDGSKVATCTAQPTGSWSVRGESSQETFWNLKSGEHTVTLTMESGYYIMDYFVLTKN